MEKPDNDVVIVKGAAIGKTEVNLTNAERGTPSRLKKALTGMSASAAGMAIAAGAAATATGALGRTIERLGKDVPLSMIDDPVIRNALDALGGIDKSKAPPDTLTHESPLAKFVKVRFDGEVRPDDVLSYNVTEGWIECGRYITISGERRWKRERGRILSYKKTGKVEPFWR